MGAPRRARAGAVRPGPIVLRAVETLLLAAAVATTPLATVQAAVPKPDQAGRLCLTVRLYPSGPELFRAFLPVANPVFSVAFRHSVEKTVVVEHFRILTDDGAGGEADRPAFVLFGTEYRSLGAGLPPEGDLQQGPDGPVLAMKLWRKLETLVIRVMPMTEHTLILPDGRRIALAERVAQAGPDGKGSTALPGAGAVLQLLPACGEETGEGTDG